MFPIYKARVFFLDEIREITIDWGNTQTSLEPAPDVTSCERYSVDLTRCPEDTINADYQRNVGMKTHISLKLVEISNCTMTSLLERKTYAHEAERREL